MSAKNPESEICSFCNASGWEPAEISGKVRRCRCLSSARVERLLSEARIPKRYEHCDLDSFEPQDDSQRVGKDYVKRFLDRYPLIDAGLLFLGTCGVGKTHLAVALLRQMILEKEDSGLFYDFRDLLREIQASWNSISQTSEMDVLRPVLNAKVLVLDELGANKPTEWVRDTIAHIINCRYNDKKITIFTSNYLDSPIKNGEETLADRIGVRLRSRLYEMCMTIEMHGKDFRHEGRQAKYYHPF